MQYTDLTAAEAIEREKMSAIVGGGITWGAALTSSILAGGVGRAHLPEVKIGEEIFQASNLGKLIQAGSSLAGLPGNNGGIKVLNDLGLTDINLPPGLVK